MAGYVLRPTRPGDLEAVTSLIHDADMSDYGVATFTADDLAAFWARPRFSLERDCLVVEAPDGSLAGYGYVWLRVEGSYLIEIGVIHPDHRGRGVGSQVLDAMGERSRVLADGSRGVVVSNVVPAEDRAARSLLTSRGYVFERRFWQMEKELTVADDVSLPGPQGVVVERVEPGRHDQEIHALIQESFRDHWRFSYDPFEEWRRAVLKQGRPAWVIARADTGIVGAVVGWAEGGIGRIDQVGVLGSWRRRGVGEALLRRAFAELRRMGATNVDLSVDSENETGATGLYERVGMSSTMAYVFFDRTIS